MHWITQVNYESDYRLRLRFQDGAERRGRSERPPPRAGLSPSARDQSLFAPPVSITTSIPSSGTTVPTCPPIFCAKFPPPPRPCWLVRSIQHFAQVEGGRLKAEGADLLMVFPPSTCPLPPTVRLIGPPGYWPPHTHPWPNPLSPPAVLDWRPSIFLRKIIGRRDLNSPA